MAFDYCLFVRPENRDSRVAYLLIKSFIDEWAIASAANWIPCGTATGIATDQTINFYKKMDFTHTGSFLEISV